MWRRAAKGEAQGMLTVPDDGEETGESTEEVEGHGMGWETGWISGLVGWERGGAKRTRRMFRVTA